MGTNMKTTIDIADPLLQEAKKVASREHTTLRSLIEEGLRTVIVKHKQPGKKFKLQKASFNGNGLQEEFRGEGWEKIRSEAYKGHGG